MSDKLKPCPFCGSDAVVQGFVKGPYAPSFWGQCSGEECPMEMLEGPHCETKELAIAAWNTRAETPWEQAAKGLAEALETIRGGVQLMVPEPQQSAFLKICDDALATYRALSGATEAKTERTGEEKR